MAIEQQNVFGIDNFDLTSIQDTLKATYKGKNDISLSNYDNDLEPVVRTGSVFENDGDVYLITESDISPSAYGGIAPDSYFYLFHDKSSNSFIYGSFAPSWSYDKQGWYFGDARAFFKLFKDAGGTLYQEKLLLLSRNNIKTAGNFSIEKNLKVGGDSNYIGDVTISGKVRWKHYYTDPGPLESAIFTALSSWVPNTGDVIACIGGYSVYSFVGMNRISGTQIRIVRVNTGTGGSTTLTITSGSATPFLAFEIMSNFDSL